MYNGITLKLFRNWSQYRTNCTTTALKFAHILRSRDAQELDIWCIEYCVANYRGALITRTKAFVMWTLASSQRTTAEHMQKRRATQHHYIFCCPRLNANVVSIITHRTRNAITYSHFCCNHSTKYSNTRQIYSGYENAHIYIARILHCLALLLSIPELYCLTAL